MKDSVGKLAPRSIKSVLMTSNESASKWIMVLAELSAFTLHQRWSALVTDTDTSWLLGRMEESGMWFQPNFIKYFKWHVSSLMSLYLHVLFFFLTSCHHPCVLSYFFAYFITHVLTSFHLSCLFCPPFCVSLQLYVI